MATNGPYGASKWLVLILLCVVVFVCFMFAASSEPGARRSRTAERGAASSAQESRTEPPKPMVAETTEKAENAADPSAQAEDVRAKMKDWEAALDKPFPLKFDLTDADPETLLRKFTALTDVPMKLSADAVSRPVTLALVARNFREALDLLAGDLNCHVNVLPEGVLISPDEAAIAR